MDTPVLDPKEGAQSNKPPRFRSVAYPSNSIAHCVDLTTRINKVFGNITYTSREALSKELGISDSHLQSQLSSCVQYGLLELKPGDGYKPTPLFTKIYKPLPTENPTDALIECFQNPELYKVIIKQFDGVDLPQQGGLSTILYRNHKVSEQASSLVARIFIENAKAVGVLKEDNSFKIDQSNSSKDEIPFEEIKKQIKDEQPAGNFIILPPGTNPPGGEVNPRRVVIPVLLDDGSSTEVPLPNGISRPDIERIVKILTAYL